MSTLDEALMHYGVKGMKWGVRRTDRATRVARRAAPSEVKTKVKPALRGSQAVKVTNRSGGRVATAGGKRNIADEDAVKVAVTKQLARSSTTNALSNKQLKEAVTRMNLEKQFADLTKDENKRTRGQRLVGAILSVAGEATMAQMGGTSASTSSKSKKKPN